MSVITEMNIHQRNVNRWVELADGIAAQGIGGENRGRRQPSVTNQTCCVAPTDSLLSAPRNEVRTHLPERITLLRTRRSAAALQ